MAEFRYYPFLIKDQFKEQQSGLGYKYRIETASQYQNDKQSQEYIDAHQFLEDRFSEFTDVHSQFKEIMLTDSTGNIVYTSGRHHQKHIGEQIDTVYGFHYSIFDKAKQDIFLSPIIMDSKHSSGHTMIISAPLFLQTQNNRFIGEITGEVDLSFVESLISERTGLGDTGEVVLGHRTPTGDAMFVYQRRFEDESTVLSIIPKDRTDVPIIQALNGNERVFDGDPDYRGENVLAATVYLSEVDLGLVVKIDEAEALSGINSLLRIFFFISILFIAIFILLSIWISLIIVNPIKKLQLGIKRVEKGDLNHTVSTNSKDEIGILSRAFDKMTSAVRQSRAHVDIKVEEQTEDLQSKSKNLADQQKAILNILEDVEHERDNTQKLANDLEKFRLAVENASDHVVITDPEGTIIYSNKSVTRITGFEYKDLIAKKAGTKDNWGGQMNDDFYKKLWHTIKVDKKVFEGEIINKRKNGEKYTALSSIFPVQNNSGDVQFIVDIERDVSKEREYEKKLQKTVDELDKKSGILETQKARLDSLFSSIGDGIVVTDKEGHIVLVNQSTIDLLGYSEKELIGKNVSKSINIVDESGSAISVANRPMEKSIASGEAVYSDLTKPYYYVKKNGDKFPVGITVTPFIVDKQIVGVVEIFRDITQERIVDQMKTEFVSLASHQLRTPLTSIKWYAELFSEEQDNLNDTQKDFLNEIHTNSKRMIRLVNDLLNVSRLEMGRLKINPTNEDLVEIVKEVMKETEPLSIKKKCKVAFTGSELKLSKMPLDKVLIKQVINNLVTNSIKYSKDKGCSVHVDLKLNEEKDIILAVSDNGIGIPADMQEKMFEKFNRADNAKKIDSDGTGLGLYIARMILDESGGKIWFESVENEGTTFFVQIPKSGMKTKKGAKGLAVTTEQ